MGKTSVSQVLKHFLISGHPSGSGTMHHAEVLEGHQNVAREPSFARGTRFRDYCFTHYNMQSTHSVCLY